MPRKKRPPLPGGKQFGWWIAQAAKDIRLGRGVHPGTVAALADVNQRTIDRFELSESWPDDPDRYIAAYAKAAGISDGREIYERALKRWRAEGPPLTLDEPQTGPERYRARGAAEQARQQARRADREKPTASPKKRASG